MGRGVAGGPGGIFGLCAELDEHAEAIEYDLIALGLRLDDLGTPALSWRDLLVVLRNAPPGSAYARALGEDTQWTLTDHLLAAVIDSLETANWQRQGKPHAPRPARVPRPGTKAATTTFGHDPIPISQFDAWWYGEENHG